MSKRQSLEAICGLEFLDSLREQGTKLQDADAAQLSVAFHAAAVAVVKADRKRSWPEPWNSNRKHHAVIEAAKRAKDSIYYAQGHAEKLGIDWPGLEELLSVLDALDSEEE